MVDNLWDKSISTAEKRHVDICLKKCSVVKLCSVQSILPQKSITHQLSEELDQHENVETTDLGEKEPFNSNYPYVNIKQRICAMRELLLKLVQFLRLRTARTSKQHAV